MNDQLPQTDLSIGFACCEIIIWNSISEGIPTSAMQATEVAVIMTTHLKTET